MTTDAQFVPGGRTQRERMLAGDFYVVDEELTREAERAAASRSARTRW